MSERTKKIIFAFGFVIVSIAMGYFVYRIIFGTPIGIPTPTGDEPQIPSGTLPQANTGRPTSTTGGATGLGGQLSALPPLPRLPDESGETNENPRNTLLTSNTTQNVVPASDNNGARFYNADDGRFYRVNADGTMSSIGEKQFFNVKNVDWGKTTDQTILEFPDGSNIYYDFQSKRQVQLPTQWEDFDFAPNDSQIVGKSIGSDPNNRFLFVSKPDGSEARAIEPLGTNAELAHSTWSPGSAIVAYADIGEEQPEGGSQVHFIGANQERLKALNLPGHDFLPNWSPTGKQIVYSVWNLSNDNKPQIWIISGEPQTLGANRRNLKLSTWADKCAWSGDTDLYCGVPQALPYNAGLNRAEFNNLPDDIYHIDLQTGTAVKVNPPEQNIPIKNPVVTADKSKLIYTDASSGRLYRFDLK